MAISFVTCPTCGTIQAASLAPLAKSACYRCRAHLQGAKPAKEPPPDRIPVALPVLNEAENQYVASELVKRGLAPDDWSTVLIAPLLWSGWEHDTDLVVIRVSDGHLEGVVLGSTDAPMEPISTLRDRLVAYTEAAQLARSALALMETGRTMARACDD